MRRVGPQAGTPPRSDRTPVPVPRIRRQVTVTVLDIKAYLATVPDLLAKDNGAEELRWLHECGLANSELLTKLHANRKPSKQDRVDGLTASPDSPLIC